MHCAPRPLNSDAGQNTASTAVLQAFSLTGGEAFTKVAEPLQNGVIGWHRRSVLHIGSDAAGYEVHAKRLTIIVQQKFHGEISSGEVRRLLECT